MRCRHARPRAQRVFLVAVFALSAVGHGESSAVPPVSPASGAADAGAEAPQPRVRYRLISHGGSSAVAEWVPLDRQAVLQGPVEMRAELQEKAAARWNVRQFAVAVGAKPLCSARLLDGICRFDFGAAPGSWTLRLSASVRDRVTGEAIDWKRTVSTLEGRLAEETTRFATSGARTAMQERTEASEVPADEIRRIALVVDRNGNPRAGLGAAAFRLSIAGVKGEAIVDVVPMSRIDAPRLLFVLVDVSPHLLQSGRRRWRETYEPFVSEVVASLHTVTAPGRKLLLVRYAGSAQASPILDLDADGVEAVGSWLLRPPPATWQAGQGGRTVALLQAYDVFLHDFDGQALGVVISGGQDNVGRGASILDEPRLAELNPVWPAAKRSALLAELDAGLIELFPHTEQRGFPLSWVYLSGTAELTRSRFEDATNYFRGFGGEVYRMAGLRDRDEREGHTARSGTLWLDEVLQRCFLELEASYRVDMRIPNPKQRRVDRTIQLRVDGSVVRTQTFYRPSESLQANIERYVNSASKERRLRAAYAARDYPLDERIYRKVASWLEDEPSSQVQPILEESFLLMTFKRVQAPAASVRRNAHELLMDPALEVGAANGALLSTLRQLAARLGDDDPPAATGDGTAARSSSRRGAEVQVAALNGGQQVRH